MNHRLTSPAPFRWEWLTTAILAFLPLAAPAAGPDPDIDVALGWTGPTTLSGTGTGSIGSGDFNRDGFIDIAVAKTRSGGVDHIWLEGPDFTTSHKMGDVTSGAAYAAACADVNGDTWPDFAVSSGVGGSDPGIIWLYLHPGSAAASTGSWQQIEVSNLDVWHQNDMEIADLDDDGKLDIVVRTRTDSRRVVVALQNTPTDWTVRSWPTGETRNEPEGLAVGNLDSDPELEILLSGTYWDNPDGWRTADPITYTIDSAFDDRAVKSVIADFDCDGDNDVYIGAAETTDVFLAVYENTGDPTGGATAWPRTILKGSAAANGPKFGNAHMAEAEDFDGDGDLDLAIGRAFGDRDMFIFYNSGDGKTWLEENFDTNGQMYVAVIEDLDQDGDIDIAGPNVWQGNIRIYLNQKIPDGGGPSDPPEAASNLTATATSPSRIDLSWTDNADDESSFVIERQEGGSPFAQVAVAGVDATSFVDTGLSASTEFTYRVVARNSAGEATPSNEATATTLPPDTTPPAAPTGLAAVADSAFQVTLTWDANTEGDLDFYRIYREGQEQGTTPGTTFSDTGLTPETAYSYTVTAVDTSENESAPSGSAGTTTLQAPDVSDALVAHWKLDEEAGTTAADVLGSNPGTLSGGPVWQPDAGQVSGALLFAGGDDKVDIGPLDIAGGDGLTVSAWVRPSSFAGVADEGRFVSKASGTSGDDHYWMLGNFLNGTALRFRLKTSSGGTETLISPEGQLTIDEWSHVAATYDGSQMRLYLNGSEVASVAKTGTVSTSASVNAALGNQPAGDRGFAGVLDDVCIFNTALSPTEIAAHMVGSTDEDPFADWMEGFGIPAGTAASHDGDADGLTLLLEYAVGTDPTSPDPLPINASMNETGTAFDLTYPELRDELTYRIEMSTDLVGWGTAGVTQGEGTASVPATGTRVFTRLAVEQ